MRAHIFYSISNFPFHFEFLNVFGSCLFWGFFFPNGELKLVVNNKDLQGKMSKDLLFQLMIVGSFMHGLDHWNSFTFSMNRIFLYFSMFNLSFIKLISPRFYRFNLWNYGLEQHLWIYVSVFYTRIYGYVWHEN
jgi:hypothetical protein